ncbi:MAG: CRISPR-associated helicase Cas3' [Clostridiales bacterium]|nr:CRISPR-associated helicase Cas3' [Clostridiales bacterium]
MWAKAGDNRGGAYHPLLYHTLDVAACADRLWEHTLTPAARAQVAQAFYLNEDEARRLAVFLAGVHDIGKASPAFQRKVPELRIALEDLDYDFDDRGITGAHHSIVSAWVLSSWLKEVLSWEQRTARRLARVVGAHHGAWPHAGALADLGDKRLADVGRNPIWSESRGFLLKALAEVVKPPRGVRINSNLKMQNGVLVLLAGFITVADWLGSMEDYFSYEDARLSAEEYWPLARERAQRALKATGWLDAWQGDSTVLPFESLFNFTPRPFQEKAISLSEKVEHPALLIVEAPTGQGKTELALYLADVWLQTRGGRGLYIAMPTQATSNAMFGRLRDFLARRYPEKHVPVVLAHSFAEDVLPRLLEEGEDKGEEVITVHSWFLPRKRALLASFGVGTVDQALVGALQARHHFLRLFGLAHKVVIFDEVHAYDTYMEHLFERLLTWLRAVGTSVIVLSATLPEGTRKKIARAWGAPFEDLNHNEVPFPRLTLVTPREERGTTVRVKVHPLPTPPDREVKLNWLKPPETEPDRLASCLKERLAQGGCAVVICNTVDKAQTVYSAVRDYFAPEERLLFHARMPFAWRTEVEEEVLRLFGKNGAKSGERPKRFVLVATQVVEQSLDVDFDFMVSELAPVDLLIQRAGRLHRHENEHENEKIYRPNGLQERQLWLLSPGNSLTAPDFGSSRFVYAPYILWRTLLALQSRSTLRLPADTDELIRLVYRPWEGNLDPLVASLGVDDSGKKALSRKLEEAWKDWQRQTEDASSQAKVRLIVRPDKDVLPESWAEDLDDDEEALKHPDLKALTRLVEPSITLLPLHKQRDGRLTLEPEGEWEVDNWQHPDDEMARRMRRYLITVPHRELSRIPDMPETPRTWKKVAGLRHAHPVFFEEGQARIGAWVLTLDREFGLRLQKEGRTS